MAEGGSAATMANSGGVRIVVAGDRGTGKTSLIVTAAVDKFPTNAPPLMPPTKLPLDIFPDRVPITIIDTSSRFPPLLPLSLSQYILYIYTHEAVTVLKSLSSIQKEYIYWLRIIIYACAM